MARKSNKSMQTALIVGSAGVLAYLIFSKKAAPAQTTVGPTAPTLSQAKNLLNTLLPSFFPTSASQQQQAAAAASNPSNLFPTDILPSADYNPQTFSPAADAPNVLTVGPSAGADILNTSGGSTSDYISSDAGVIDEASIAGAFPSSWTGKPLSRLTGAGAQAYDWSGQEKGVFRGGNRGMFPFTEINGTDLAVLAGCLACGLPPKGIGKVNLVSFIIPLGVVVGGYLLLKNTKLFSGSPFTATGENNAATQASNQAALDKSITAAANQGDIQTLTTAQAASLANDIFVQGSQSPPNLDQIEHDVIQANTLSDLLQMIKAFGVRQMNTGSWLSLCAFFSMNCTALDMPTFVRLVLDSDHLNAVNNYLSAQGINYQF